jgi:hypothetical protein
MQFSAGDLQSYQNDKKDLFAAVNELGGVKDEYDVETDSIVSKFKRGDAWREAMKAIRT